MSWLDLRDAWRQFDEAVAPVPSTHGFLLATALAVALVAYTSDTFASGVVSTSKSRIIKSG